MCTTILLLTACGLKGSLIRPSDIPKYEADKAKRERQYDAEPAPKEP